MTEAEWLGATDPDALLGSLKENPDRRRRRLGGCACCRRVLQYLDHQCYPSWLSAVEAVADGERDEAELPALHEALRTRIDPTQPGPAFQGVRASVSR